jgi:GNAT superfamily N-acetyltransferase
MIFEYQKLGLDDIPLLQEVGRASYVPYYPHIWRPGGLEWYVDKCFNTETLQTELSDPNYEYLIPRDAQGQIIGILKLILEKPVLDSPISNALYLEKIYLMPDFFGKGAGQKLMEFVFEKAAALGREAVWLMCMENGPVWAYERAGFQTIGPVYWDFELLQDAERKGWVMVKAL